MDQEFLFRKWQRQHDKGIVFESITFNTKEKMERCFKKLETERSAFTFVLKMGGKILGYSVYYLPNWRRIEVG